MKRIQIYGLPRTGTNYLEFLVINNLDCEYYNKYNDGGRSYFPHKNVAIKHCSPDVNDADNFIFILKLSGNFLNSFKKWKKMSDKKIIDMYKNALNDYLKFYNENEKNTIIVFHEDLIGNEKKILENISKKFDLELIHPTIKTTNKRMGRGGGTNFESKNYEFNDVSEIEINDDYNKIKKLKTC